MQTKVEGMIEGAGEGILQVRPNSNAFSEAMGLYILQWHIIVEGDSCPRPGKGVESMS